MHNLNKFFCIAIVAAFCAAYASGDTASFEGSACTVGVEYNSEVLPGDAIVVRMTLRGKERKRAAQDTVAQAQLRTETKKIDSAQFFYINQKAKRQNLQELLAYVPISIWVSDGAYTIKVVYSAFGTEAEEFTLPITVIKKDFISETIALDARNTGIRTNTSPERVAQSEKLNTLLETVILSDVYTIKPFVPPVAADRIRQGTQHRVQADVGHIRMEHLPGHLPALSSRTVRHTLNQRRYLPPPGRTTLLETGCVGPHRTSRTTQPTSPPRNHPCRT